MACSGSFFSTLKLFSTQKIDYPILTDQVVKRISQIVKETGDLPVKNIIDAINRAKKDIESHCFSKKKPDKLELMMQEEEQIGRSADFIYNELCFGKARDDFKKIIAQPATYDQLINKINDSNLAHNVLNYFPFDLNTICNQNKNSFGGAPDDIVNYIFELILGNNGGGESLRDCMHLMQSCKKYYANILVILDKAFKENPIWSEFHHIKHQYYFHGEPVKFDFVLKNHSDYSLTATMQCRQLNSEIATIVDILSGYLNKATSRGKMYAFYEICNSIRADVVQFLKEQNELGKKTSLSEFDYHLGDDFDKYLMSRDFILSFSQLKNNEIKITILSEGNNIGSNLITTCVSNIQEKMTVAKLVAGILVIVVVVAVIKTYFDVQASH